MPGWPQGGGAGLEFCTAYMDLPGQDIANNSQENIAFETAAGESWWNQGGDGAEVIRPSTAAGTYLAVANMKLADGHTSGLVFVQPTADSAVPVADPGSVLPGAAALSGIPDVPVSATGTFVVSGTNFFRLLVTNTGTGGDITVVYATLTIVRLA